MTKKASTLRQRLQRLRARESRLAAAFGKKHKRLAEELDRRLKVMFEEEGRILAQIRAEEEQT